MTHQSSIEGRAARPLGGGPSRRILLALAALGIALIIGDAFLAHDVGPPPLEAPAPVRQDSAPAELSVVDVAGLARTVVESTVEVQMAPGRRAVVGRVLDAESGTPIAGADVLLRNVTPSAGAILLAGRASSSPATVSALTDPQGCFAVDVGLTEWCALTARHDDFAPSTRSIHLGTHIAPRVLAGDLLLHPLSTADIVVVDEQGVPFAGTLAFAAAPPFDANSGQLDGYPLTSVDLNAPLASADDGGRLRVRFDPDRGQDLILIHPEAVPARLRPSTFAQARRVGRLELRRGVATAVTVRRGDDRLPDRFEVSVALRELQVCLRCVVSAGKRVACGALGHPSLPRELCVTVDGVGGRGAWMQKGHDFAASPDCEMRVERVRTGGLLVRWPVAFTDAPIVVGLLGRSTLGDYLTRVERANLLDGEITLYPAWGSQRVVLYCPRLGTWTSPWVQIRADDLTLQAQAWRADCDDVTVEVHDGDGVPVPDCNVELSFGGGHPNWPLPLKALDDAARGSPQRRLPLQAASRTDASGCCRFEGVLSGGLRVVAAAGSRTAVAAFPARSSRVTVRLETSGSVEGRIRATALLELCAANVQVVLTPDAPDTPSYESPVSLDGSFSHAGVRPGTYGLRVEMPHENFRDLLAVPGRHGSRNDVLHTSPLRVRAGEVERVEVPVSAEALQPSLTVHLAAVTDGMIELRELTGRGASGWQYRLPFDRRATLRLLGLPAGDWFARVDTPSGSAWLIVSTNPGPAEMDLSLQLPRVIRWPLPTEMAGDDCLRLVPCGGDSTHWLSHAAVAVAAQGMHLVAQGVLDGSYLLQAQRSGRWVDGARVTVHGDTVREARAPPR